jgi:CRISPR system Cascade subunit CasC
MNGKNFINYHILISHSPSCLNRDDMNMQKTAVFGGVNRVRISSQSLKRAMRTSDYYSKHLGKPSFRTRDLDRAKDELFEALKDDFDRALVEEAANRFVATASVSDEEDEDQSGHDVSEDKNTTEPRKKLAVAPWVKEEIKVLCSIIHDVKKEGIDEKEREKALKKVGKTVGKGQDKRKLTEADCLATALNEKISKRLEERTEILRGAIGKAVDVALSGRMATSGLMLSVDGAFALAHAITTHAVEPQDVDWFTAVDDLVEDAGETGAGHLDTQQFSAGVFYRYASLNLKQLQVNLGLIEKMASPETVESRKQALKIAGHLFNMLTTVVPSAKQQSFAAHNLADFAIVSFADQPISLTNAFEAPIQQERNGGYLLPSITALSKYWERINEFYSLDEQAAAASIKNVNLSKELKDCSTIKGLEKWIVGNGKGTTDEEGGKDGSISHSQT